MGIDRKPLYDREKARCLGGRGIMWQHENQKKFSLLLENIGSCERLVDIGCGWGQLLGMAQEYVSELWGVDESPEMIKRIKRNCPKVNVVTCRANNLLLPDSYFDIAITSQMLHEVKLFGEKSDLRTTLLEIRRILKDNGRYFLLDHLDAGDGEIMMRLPKEEISKLLEFEKKFKFYKADHEMVGDNIVKISKLCLQDFLTKYWSFNTPMESMEMNETHNVFRKSEIVGLIESLGFSVSKWVVFSNIQTDIKRVKGELLEGSFWFRKFLCVAKKL